MKLPKRLTIPLQEHIQHIEMEMRKYEYPDDLSVLFDGSEEVFYEWPILHESGNQYSLGFIACAALAQGVEPETLLTKPAPKQPKRKRTPKPKSADGKPADVIQLHRG